LHDGDLSAFYGEVEETISALATIASEFLALGGDISFSRNLFHWIGGQEQVLLVKFMQNSEDIAEGMPFVNFVSLNNHDTNQNSMGL
jgi:hypothetical protein